MTTTAPVDYDVIRQRLDHAVIAADAEYAAGSLRSNGYASVFVSPGDMTEYHFAILAAGAVEMHDYHGVRGRRDYLVTLANSFGATYAWDGREVHPSYATSKWTRGGGERTVTDHHTGTVVASFLSALAAALAVTP